jgi:hypothetical protein
MIETRPNRSWYDDNWDWALIALFALVLLAGVVILQSRSPNLRTGLVLRLCFLRSLACASRYSPIHLHLPAPQADFTSAN